MFDINEEMTYLVYVMQKRMRRQMSAALDRDDITLEQYVVLYNLVDQDGINQKSLSHKVDKDQATLARILDILENRGYVVRRTTEEHFSSSLRKRERIRSRKSHAAWGWFTRRLWRASRRTGWICLWN